MTCSYNGYKTGGAGNTSFMGVAVSGASTVAASDANSANSAAHDALNTSISRTFILTGLTAGSNTFTAKYHNDGGSTWHFFNRSITVLAP